MILIIAEHNNATLNPATSQAIGAATQLPGEISVLVAGCNCLRVCSEAQKISGVTQVLHADHQVYKHHLSENLAQLIASIADQYTYILAPATTFGKDLLPRVAALLDVEQISDISAIIDANTFVRPIYAGNALATVSTTARKKILTIRSTAFAASVNVDTGATIKSLDIVIPTQNTKFITMATTEHGAMPDLNAAQIVVAGGRGFASKENFSLLNDLAQQLHAAIGASRAAVDAGYVPNDLQIGQTGKVIAPDLYIAIGISGAIQHLAGIKDSKVIVAINKDPEAPIFQIADYGLVADLFEAVPQFIAALSNDA